MMNSKFAVGLLVLGLLAMSRGASAAEARVLTGGQEAQVKAVVIAFTEQEAQEIIKGLAASLKKTVDGNFAVIPDAKPEVVVATLELAESMDAAVVALGAGVPRDGIVLKKLAELKAKNVGVSLY